MNTSHSKYLRVAGASLGQGSCRDLADCAACSLPDQNLLWKVALQSLHKYDPMIGNPYELRGPLQYRSCQD